MSDKYNTSLETNLNKVRVVLILSYVTKFVTDWSASLTRNKELRKNMQRTIIIIWQAFVLMNRAIWLAADEAGFSRIAHGQYTIFIALRREPSFKRQKMSKSLSNYSKRRKEK